eukprot:442911-Alexandrium_andersonii.AAC.1
MPSTMIGRARASTYPPHTPVVELSDAVSDFRGLAAEVEARAEAARLRTLGEVNRRVARLVEQQEEQLRRTAAIAEQRRQAA